MEKVTLKAQPRKESGTKIARKLRTDGMLPAVIYGHGEPPESVTLAEHEVEVALHHGARTLNVNLNGTTKPYLIKEVQYDHLESVPIHIDLARVDLKERVKVTVGIELKGTPKGVSEGGLLELLMPDIEVECEVTNIPNTLNPIVSNLGLDEALYVRDLEFPPGVTPLADPDERVATVKVLAIHEEPEETTGDEGEGDAGAEPERIGRVRKDEEESGKGD